MSTLQVLCPNGRRQNVKITPNTKILQVLEDVCHKQKFLPPEEYKLIHGRKTLDVTLSVRYANLPNNAKLELVKSEKSREESEVLIALQLEGGDRLQHTFSPGTTLWEVLLHWENTPDSPHKGVLTHIDSSKVPSIQPVCIYMREEVVGEESLKETQLRALGLTGGKAVIRLIHRPVEDEVLAQISDKLEKERQRKARLGAPVAQQPSAANSSAISESQLITDVQSESQVSSAMQSGHKQLYSETENKFGNGAEPGVTAAGSSSVKEEPAAKKGKPESESHDTGDPMETESVDQMAERHQPMEADIVDQNGIVRNKAEFDNTVNTSRQEQRKAAERLRSLNIPGVEVYTPDDFDDLTPEQQQVARQLAQAYLPSLGIQQATANHSANAKPKKTSDQKKVTTPQSPFADFKFPEETKGKNLYSNEMSEVKQEDFKPCDRQTVLFNIEEEREHTPTDSEELPDEFFDITDRDLRILMADQKKKMDAMEAQPLMTSSLRKAKLEEEYSRYDRVIIRVQFPDKLVLQGMFRPRETVFSLQKFVKDHLEEKSCPFYLYTSPPKHVLSDVSHTLIEARLVPATVVYFGSEEHKDHYLSSAVLCEINNKMSADRLVYECLSGSSNNQDEKDQQTTSSGSSKGKQPKSVTKGSSDKSGGAQLPKWFKTSKK